MSNEILENEEQISLFSFMFEKHDEDKKDAVVLKKEVKQPVTKPSVPEILIRISESKTLEEMMRYFPVKGIKDGTDDINIKYLGYRYTDSHLYDRRVIGNDVIPTSDVMHYSLSVAGYRYSSNISEEMNIIYFTDDGTGWQLPVKMEFDDRVNFFRGTNRISCKSLTFKKPSVIKKLLDFTQEGKGLEANVIINANDVSEILKTVNPYGYAVLEKDAVLEKVNKERAAEMLVSPQIEQLIKADYKFVTNFINGHNQDYIDAFNRLTQPGKNLKEIFKCSKTLYSSMRDIEDIKKWDIYRKMEKQGKFTKDTLIQAIDANYGEWELEWSNRILNRKHNGKPVFTWDTLQNYLRRLDTFQALSGKDAFQILYDYLNMCEQLDIVPRIDSDSLKREHDVTARTLREKHNEIMSSKMKGACEYLKVNDYEEDVYFIRGIRDYDDLIDEAKQQRNCVAGYAQSIINRKSLIYVMRYKSAPNSSLITVEIDPSQTKIRQKYLACNRPVHNRSQSEFLDRWISKVRLRVKLGDDHIPNINREQVYTCS